jgi:hypothetical protein
MPACACSPYQWPQLPLDTPINIQLISSGSGWSTITPPLKMVGTAHVPVSCISAVGPESDVRLISLRWMGVTYFKLVFQIRKENGSLQVYMPAPSTACWATSPIPLLDGTSVVTILRYSLACAQLVASHQIARVFTETTPKVIAHEMISNEYKKLPLFLSPL